MIRKSAKKQRHAHSKKKRITSTRTDTVKVHTRYVQSESRDVSVCAPPSQQSSSAAENPPPGYIPPLNDHQQHYCGQQHGYEGQRVQTQGQRVQTPPSSSPQHPHHHFHHVLHDDSDQPPSSRRYGGDIAHHHQQMAASDSLTSTPPHNNGDSTPSTLCSSSVDTFHREILITRTTKQQWNKENIPHGRSKVRKKLIFQKILLRVD